MQDLISIIIPTYNRAHFILETVASIQQQTYTNWELLILDDGSTDGTDVLMEQLDDKRISYHQLGKIGIGGKLKNIGIDMANGEWIALMDSDDLWHENKLEKQMAALEQFPEAMFSLTGGYNFKEKGISLERHYEGKEGSLQGNLFIPFCKAEVAVFLQTLVFRKSCIKTAGLFDEDYPFTDFGFMAILAYHFSGVLLYEELLFRRIHNENYSSQHWDTEYLHYFKAMQGLINNKMLNEKLGRQLISNAYLQLGERYIQASQKQKAIASFIKASKANGTFFIALKKMFMALFR